MTTTATLAGLLELLERASIAVPVTLLPSNDGERGIIFDANHESVFRPLDPEAAYAESDIETAEYVAAILNAAPALLARIAALTEALEEIAATAPSENGWSSDAHMKCCALARAALTLKENDCGQG